jgi:hypothetical protein
VLNARKGSTKPKDQKQLRILLDSGCGATLINHSMVRKLQKAQSKTNNWTTKAGSFKTNMKCTIQFKMPAFHEHKLIQWNAYVETSNPQENRYDLIIGRDLMHAVGIYLLVSEGMMKWDNATIPMAPISQLLDENIASFKEEIMATHEHTEADRIQEILDSKYKPTDLNKISAGCHVLTPNQQQKLLHLLNKYSNIFDGTLGTWNTKPVDLELKDPNCKPIMPDFIQYHIPKMKLKGCAQMAF